MNASFHAAARLFARRMVRHLNQHHLNRSRDEEGNLPAATKSISFLKAPIETDRLANQIRQTGEWKLVCHHTESSFIYTSCPFHRRRLPTANIFFGAIEVVHEWPLMTASDRWR